MSNEPNRPKRSEVKTTIIVILCFGFFFPPLWFILLGAPFLYYISDKD